MGPLLETASWACSPSITVEDRGFPPTKLSRGSLTKASMNLKKQFLKNIISAPE